MALGAGQGFRWIRGETATAAVMRPHRIYNQFNYIEPHRELPGDPYGEPGGYPPTTLLQPKVPVNRAEKEQAQCAADYVRTVANLRNPVPLYPPKRGYPRNTQQSVLALTLARSRTSMLSEQRG